MNNTRKRIDAAIQREKMQRIKTREFIHMLQNKCKHTDVVETSLGTHPPFRVCRECGYAEQGWGCGYWKLNGPGPDTPQLPERVCSSLVTIRVLSQEEMNNVRYART